MKHRTIRPCHKTSAAPVLLNPKNTHSPIRQGSTGHVAVYRSSGHVPKQLKPFGFDYVCYCSVHLQGRSHCFVSDSVAPLHTGYHSCPGLDNVHWR